MDKNLDANRLELAKRRNQRRLGLPEFSAGVLKALGSQIDIEPRLTDLEDSIVFDQSVQKKLSDLRSRNDLEATKTRYPERLRQEVDRFFGASPEVDYLVLFSRWGHVGAVRLKGRELQSGLLSLLEWDGDTVYGGTENLEAVFLFDLTQIDEGTRLYEALHWTVNS